MIVQSQPSPDAIVFKGSSDFLKTIRARVDRRLVGRSRFGDGRLYRKALIIGLWFVASYALLLTIRVGWEQLLACISLGLAACALGFNVFHDANHGSFSPSRRVNLAVSVVTCTALGASRYFWWYKHQVLHHRFPNIFRWDDDIETRGCLRLSAMQPWRPRFKNQHRFFFLLYALGTLEWFFVKDFVQYFTRWVNSYQRTPTMSRGQKLEFWMCKGVYAAIFLALPLAVMPAWRVLVGLLVFHVTLSLTLTFIFNLAHQVEKVDFPAPAGEPATIAEDWAAHQMRTTANFATGNRLLNWFAGGLNFQIEHHLFPRISHTLYPDISGIVRRTAREFDLPYHHYETYFAAVQSHYRFLRELGQETSPA